MKHDAKFRLDCSVLLQLRDKAGNELNRRARHCVSEFRLRPDFIKLFTKRGDLASQFFGHSLSPAGIDNRRIAEAEAVASCLGAAAA